jgi:carbamate kinase
MTLAEARRWLADGQFPAGSMGPKIEAVARFLEGGGREAIITSPDRLCDAVEGKAGTRIFR